MSLWLWYAQGGGQAEAADPALGAELLDDLKQRLALNGLVDETLTDAVLYGLLKKGRNKVRQDLATAVPARLKETVALTTTDSVTHALPTHRSTPLRLLEVRDQGNERGRLTASTRPKDGGQYERTSPRTFRLRSGVTVSAGLEVVAVFPVTATITAATTDEELGVPPEAYDAVVHWAAVLALTADEETNADNERTLFEGAMGSAISALSADDDQSAREIQNVFGEVFVDDDGYWG